MKLRKGLMKSLRSWRDIFIHKMSGAQHLCKLFKLIFFIKTLLSAGFTRILCLCATNDVTENCCEFSFFTPSRLLRKRKSSFASTTSLRTTIEILNAYHDVTLIIASAHAHFNPGREHQFVT
jgi:hypothetical protein